MKKIKAVVTFPTIPTGPEVMAALQRTKLESPYIAVSAEMWVEIFASPLRNLISLPTDQRDLVAGHAGALLGCPILTDAYSDKRVYRAGFHIGTLKPDK